MNATTGGEPVPVLARGTSSHRAVGLRRHLPQAATVRAEVVAAAGTFFLVLGVAAMAIGFALAGAILISGPLTGAGVNLARAVGPMIVAGRFTEWWAYLVGPLLAGAVAAWRNERARQRP